VKTRLRLHLLLLLSAVAALVALALLAMGIPLLAARALGPSQFLLLVLAAAGAVLVAGALVLGRGVARPLDRLVEAATRLGAEGGLPPLGPPGDQAGTGLARVALAFERTAAALSEERARLAAKVAELEASNRRLAEAREELLRSERLASVGRLAAGIAHEVGNPLGAIGGYAELARAKLAAGTVDADAVDDFLRRIGTEAGRIDAIVRDLLDFARPAALALGPVQVGAALEAAARLARMQVRWREVTLQVDLPADLPPVRADERRLSQVFLNLLLNAGDAMSGAGEVRVTGRRRDGQVVVEVEDSGPGFRPEARLRLFDPFFTTKEPGQGTGLGLSVCHGLMASFGGTIEADEAPGGGARFTLGLRAEAP
jgi:C4-dicarboxylate-specific signal transduction histidine kinase